MVGLERPGLELALEGKDDEVAAWLLAGRNRPGLRRLEVADEMAGLVSLDEGCDVRCPLSRCCAEATTALGSLGALVWTGVADPDPVGMRSSRHFLTKLLALDASCLSLAFLLSSLMCLPNRVACKVDDAFTKL